jgi:hypothetical protein
MKQPIMLTSATIVRLLYTQNPFYLIGTLLVLVGLQQSLGSTPGLETSRLLTGLLAGYTLLLAAIAAAIIGYGRVWDDARTILLVIVLMFFMLSASLDVQLNSSLDTGSLLLAAGLAFSIAISELLLRGLGIGLAWRYRGPFYLILALLFAWPMVPAWLDDQGLATARSWSHLVFPVAASLVLLTLLPAARTTAEQELPSGVPWKWPLYPWSLFVYLTIGIALRSWWLTISFEPASGTEAAFGLYFLIPLVLAWSAILLEMGLARTDDGALAAGMFLPLASVFLIFPGEPTSPVAAAALARLTETLGSPAQIAAAAIAAYFAWAWLRKVPAAEGFCLAALAGASVMGPTTVDPASFTQPQVGPLAVLAGVLVLVGLWRESTARLVAGTGLIAVGSLAASWESDLHPWFWQVHGPLLALLALPAIMDDEPARLLRPAAWKGTVGLAVLAVAIYPWALPGLAPAALACYLALLLAISAGHWQRERQFGPLWGMMLTIAANALGLGRHGYDWLDQSPLGKGLPWLVAGLAAVGAALTISLLKMGLWPWLRQTAVRLRLVMTLPED